VFDRFKYSSAKNFILGSMCKQGSPKFCLTEPQAQLMADVMGLPDWQRKAAAMMRSGANKHEVLALFFILGGCQTKQLKKETGKQTLVPPKLWKVAARYALEDAGYDYAGIIKKMEQMERECELTESPPDSIQHPNSYDENGYTPLMMAVKIMNVDLVSELIQQGANPNIVDRNFGTSTALDIAGLLQKRAKGASEKKSYQEIIDILVPVTDQADHVREEEFDNHGMTRLMIAAKSGDLDEVISLLEQGADPSIRSKNKRALTAAQYASNSANASMPKADIEKIQKIILILHNDKNSR